MKFTKLYRLDVEQGVINVSTNSLFKLGLKRNDMAQVTNLDNGSVTFLCVKGDKSLRKGEVAVSYDTAVALHVENIRGTYRRSNEENLADVNLFIKKPNVVRYLIESVRTGNSVSRWLALIGIFSGIDLLISLIQQVTKLFSWVISLIV